MAKKVIPMVKEITLNGYVEEIDWEGGETGVIIDDGNDDYYVVMDETGKRLLEHVDEEVEVTGMVSKKDGEWTLKVSNFHALDYYEDEIDDYEDMDDYWLN